MKALSTSLQLGDQLLTHLHKAFQPIKDLKTIVISAANPLKILKKSNQPRFTPY